MSGTKKHSSLCYIFCSVAEEAKQCLFLHRNKKENDINQGKWTGVGGVFAQGETPEQCVLREVKEETGFSLHNQRYRGLVQFQDGAYEEYMHLFTAWVPGEKVTDAKTKKSSMQLPGLQDCPEGTLAWKPFSQIYSLDRWAGDDIFLRLLEKNQSFFHLKLVYEGENLCQAVLDGEILER